MRQLDHRAGAGPPDPARARSVASTAGGRFHFGPYRLDVQQRLLMEGDQPVEIGSRAIDLLTRLVQHAGAVVSKRDLLAAAWPDTIVEESNLRVHIAGLRKALGERRGGERFIVNVAGRGYAFVMPVSVTEPAPSVPAPSASRSLPRPLARIYGLDDVVPMLAAKLMERRFVSVVGPGGIGKTTVAVAVSEALADSFPQGILFVDLAPVVDPRLVTSALASLLGLPVRDGDAMPQLVACLRDGRRLVILDNCEHVIDAAAVLAEGLLRGAPGVHVMATTREPLRAEGEWVHRLAALETPPADLVPTAAAVLRYPAVQLFVERASARIGVVELTDEDTAAVAEICRRLDGIPLAIELCTGMTDAFGIRGAAEHLRDRHVLLTRGRRTALPRHQTLRATLDWSYELLDVEEQKVLRRLAVFVGRFTMDSAIAVVVDATLAEGDVVACIAALVAKSLVAAESVNGIAHYRLLEVTRTYLVDRLIGCGEHQQLARRHAEHYRDWFEQAAAAAALSKADWQAHDAPRINNVRAALDWAFAAGAGRTVGVPLTIAAGPVWAKLLLLDEWHGRVEQALNCLDPDADGDRRPRMQLYAAQASARLHIDGYGPALDAAWSNALAVAEQIGDHRHQLSALWGLMISTTQRSCRAALAFAERFRAVSAASGDSVAQAIGERLVGFMQHMLGDQTRARPPVERMMARHPPRSAPGDLRLYGFDQPIIGRSVLAAILLLQGFSDRALSLARAVMRDAVALDHDASLFYALSRTTCPVAIAIGDLATAEAAIALMHDRFSRHGSYDLWRQAFAGMVMLRRGALADGIAQLEAALAAMPEHSFAARFSMFSTALAEALAHDRRLEQGLHVVDAALDRARRIEELWWEAELVRVRGEIELLRGAAHAAAASFDEATAIAARQGALLLQLRSAASLARLRQQQGRPAEARASLAPVLARFTEGFDSADLTAASQLLATLD